MVDSLPVQPNCRMKLSKPAKVRVHSLSLPRRALQLMRGCYRAEVEPLQWGIRPGTGRAVFMDGVNSGSLWRPLLLCPEAAQADLGPAGAAPSLWRLRGSSASREPVMWRFRAGRRIVFLNLSEPRSPLTGA